MFEAGYLGHVRKAEIADLQTIERESLKMAQCLKMREAGVGNLGLADGERLEMRQPAQFGKTCIGNGRVVDNEFLKFRKAFDAFQSRVGDLRPRQAEALQPVHLVQVLQPIVRKIEEYQIEALQVLQSLKVFHAGIREPRRCQRKVFERGHLPKDACRGIADAARRIAHRRETQIETMKVRQPFQVDDAFVGDLGIVREIEFLQCGRILQMTQAVIRHSTKLQAENSQLPESRNPCKNNVVKITGAFQREPLKLGQLGQAVQVRRL